MAPPERHWPGLVVRYTVLLGLLALAATPAYLFVDPADRPAVVRVAVAVLIGVALLHLLGVARGRIAAQPPSAFEAALAPSRIEPRLAPLFLALRDEVRASLASQRYFARVLWPRLEKLAAGQPGRAPADSVVIPVGRHLFRRGPSLASLRGLVTEIEAKR